MLTQKVSSKVTLTIVNIFSAFLRTLDIDGDGKIDLLEFVTFIMEKGIINRNVHCYLYHKLIFLFWNNYNLHIQIFLKNI